MDNYDTLDDSGVFNDDGTSGGDADGVNMVFSGKGLLRVKRASLIQFSIYISFLEIHYDSHVRVDISNIK